jgi:hypothetical protein
VVESCSEQANSKLLVAGHLQAIISCVGELLRLRLRLGTRSILQTASSKLQAANCKLQGAKNKNELLDNMSQFFVPSYKSALWQETKPTLGESICWAPATAGAQKWRKKQLNVN